MSKTKITSLLQNYTNIHPNILSGIMGITLSVSLCGEGERVIAPEPWEGTLASTRVEEGLSRSFPG